MGGCFVYCVLFVCVWVWVFIGWWLYFLFGCLVGGWVGWFGVLILDLVWCLGFGVYGLDCVDYFGLNVCCLGLIIDLFVLVV